MEKEKSRGFSSDVKLYCLKSPVSLLEFKVRKHGLALVDTAGRIYVQHDYLPDTYTDIYQLKEYGFIEKNSESILFELGGDMETWWKWGADPMFPDFPYWKKYLGRNEQIVEHNMVDDGRSKRLLIHVREEHWYHQYSSIISPVRAAKPQKPIESSPHDPSKSVLCPEMIDKVTPEPRVWHYELPKDGNYIPVSVPNKFPFIGNHLVNAFTGSREKLSDFRPTDFENYLRIAIKNAKVMHKEKANGMISIINFGELAAASQPWPHSQDGRWDTKMITLGSREIRTYLDVCRYIEDPCKYQMNVIKSSALFAFEAEHTFVFAPFAPMLPDQVDIVIKDMVHNFLDLPENYVKDIAETMTRVLHILQKERKVSDINIVSHQTRFGDENGFRMHFHIYPRNKNRLGALEMDGLYVCDVFPETTADALRNAA